ncbi:MAG: thymidine phosphorylase [Spirochaetales bacterium]|nr:thymidine phosphorylase [Spirochaetales bacterium]MCF7938229.1 thymidine phosphorylase [Spirochaetales bacterium]
MRTVDCIVKKRDGGELDSEEIAHLIRGYVDGSIPEYQISAWLMAVYFAGMGFQETGYLTREMIDSGDTLDLRGIEGPLVDKHSTGGVGDKVSLILAPLAAACGLKVPMMSGRSLGHTGGTLDKLESIPGYTTALEPARFRSIINEVGYAMTGQSESIVPADRKLYALRDVTATVESIPLITASILSKKFAEGAESLVFDVKCGSGAFMKTPDTAEQLASFLVETGRSLDKKVAAVITSMEQPLGRMVGNFLEVEESAMALQGKGPSDLMEVTMRLTAWMLVAGRIEPDVDSALRRCRKELESGAAYERFIKNIELQGGDPGQMEAGFGVRRADLSVDLTAGEDGYIQEVNAYKTGMAGVYLGAGRSKTDDDVYPDVGIVFQKKCGDSVEKDEPLCRIFARDEEGLDQAQRLMDDAIVLGEYGDASKEMILKELPVE